MKFGGTSRDNSEWETWLEDCWNHQRGLAHDKNIINWANMDTNLLCAIHIRATIKFKRTMHYIRHRARAKAIDRIRCSCRIAQVRSCPPRELSGLETVCWGGIPRHWFPKMYHNYSRFQILNLSLFQLHRNDSKSQRFKLALPLPTYKASVWAKALP